MSELSEIDALISEEELRSFNSFRKKFNFSSESLVKEYKSKFSKYMYENKEFYDSKFSGGNEDTSKFFAPGVFESDKIQTPEDLFKFFKNIGAYYKTSCIETIKKVVPSFSANGLLTNRFYKTFPTPKDFSDFLGEIKIINTFELSIDPISYIESANKNYYVIRNHFSFDSILTHAIVPLFINFCTYVDLEGDKHRVNEKLKKKKSYTAVANILLSVTKKIETGTLQIDSLQERSNLFNPLSEEVMMLGQDCYWGIKYFSFFHEYSHILYEHFHDDSKNNLIRELEADNLAINLLSFNTENYYRNHNHILFKAVSGLRLIAPLIYFLLKIAILDHQNHTKPTFLLRWEFAKRIIEHQLDEYGLLREMNNMLNDLEAILFYLLKLKNENIKKLSDNLLSECKLAESEGLHCRVMTKDPGIKSWGFSSSVLMKSWSRITNDKKKIKRNDPCPCGSGKKFKKCCLN